MEKQNFKDLIPDWIQKRVEEFTAMTRFLD